MFIAQLSDVEASDRSRGPWLLDDQSYDLRIHDLGARAENDAVGLRIAAVTGIAGGVEEIVAVGIV